MILQDKIQFFKIIILLIVNHLMIVSIKLRIF